MMSLSSLAQYLTVYAFLASAYVFAAPASVPPFAAEVVRAVAAFVAIATVYAHARYDCREVIRRFYEKVFPAGTPRALMVAVDTIAHFLPLLANGPPRDVRAVWTGYGVVIAWYLAVRGRIQALYFDAVPTREYDHILFGVLPATAAVYSAALVIGSASPPPLA